MGKRATANDPGLTVGIVSGEGVGTEVSESALRVIDALNAASGTTLRIEQCPNLERAQDGGLPLSPAVHEWVAQCRAEGVPVLHGPAGGRFVYELRRAFDLFVKLTPVHADPALVDASILRPERVAGTDILLVRDNSAGIYQGDHGWLTDDSVFHTFHYNREQVRAVVDVAVRAAESRDGRLAVVVKAGGIPSVSQLWQQVAEDASSERVSLEILEIDNACYQLASEPTRFDVIVSPNMFGDILGDTASVALGSRGLSYSANFSAEGFGVYQTAHGAAYDIAGTDTANPIAHVLSLAWLLESSLNHADLAALIRNAVGTVLARDIRTADIAGPGSTVVGTLAMTTHIVDEIARGQ
jgi:3-isopropylmalate dehydrogenase